MRLGSQRGHEVDPGVQGERPPRPRKPHMDAGRRVPRLHALRAAQVPTVRVAEGGVVIRFAGGADGEAGLNRPTGSRMLIQSLQNGEMVPKKYPETKKLNSPGSSAG